jgi:hypothetical protein
MTAFAQVSQEYGILIKIMGTDMDTGKIINEVASHILSTYPGHARFKPYLYCILLDKVEGEAYDKIRS